MVTRCVCHEVSFADLLQIARAEGLGLDGLKARTGCCTGCGLCEPYVRVVLTTGRAELPVMTGAEVARVMARPAPGPPA